MERVGPYRITGRIGRGGMGEVFEGYDDRLDRPVALKRTWPEREADPRARQRFRREARIAARLSHQSIVQVYDWVEGGDATGDWLVMELAQGETLDCILAQGPLPAEQVVHIAYRVAEGLAAAHGAGLVHRDLKPSNVMIDGDEVKILDFGIAKRLTLANKDRATPESTDLSEDALTATGMIVGSVASMSPEQAMAWPIDARSDLFSLGSLVYEMASGEHPFSSPRQGSQPSQRSNRVAVLAAICSARETPLETLVPSLPEELTALVHRLLEKEPGRRPQSARGVVETLGSLRHRLQASAAPSLEAAQQEAQQSTVQEFLPDSGAEPSYTAVADTSTMPARAGWLWTVGSLFLVVVMVGLVGWGSRHLRKPEPAPAWSPPEPAAASASSEAEVLSLYRSGMAALERYDQPGNIDAAIAEFQRALAYDQDAVPVLAGLARAYWLDRIAGSLDPQRLDQARAVAERAVELEPEDPAALTVRGLVLNEQGQPAAARVDLERALELAPENAEVFFARARIYRSESQFEAAEVEIRQALELKRTWAYSTYLGDLLFRTGRYEEAIDTFRQSLELAPRNELTLRSLGGAYYMQGDLSTAARTFEEALEIRPSHRIYGNLGTIYFTQGLYAQAVATFEKAVNTGSGADVYVLWANLGDAYRWTPDNQEKAEASYARALQVMAPKLEAKPEDETLRSRHILYLAKKGDCDAALQAMRKLGSPASASARYRQAVAQEVCGRRDPALASLESALAAGFAASEVRADPELRALRRDVRFLPLISRFPP